MALTQPGLRQSARFASPERTRATLGAVRLVFSCLVLAALAPSLQEARSSDAMTPVVDDAPRIARHDLRVGSGGQQRALVRAVRDLAENRLDVDALPGDTPITVWAVDGDIVSFQIGAADGAFAARVDAAGAQRWVFDDGTSLDGPVLARPVRYQAISSKIGVREHPIRKRTRFHAGTDYAAPIGTPIRAIADGTVTKAARSWTAGKFLVLRHDDGVETKYMHLDTRAPGLEEGGRVRQGEVIGTVGMTGRVTGPHLHFEMRDRWRTPLDPSVQRYPAATVVDAGTLRAFSLRQQLLQTFRADGSRDVLHPLVVARDGLQKQASGDAGTHAFLPPLAGLRGPGARARLTPPPSRRRRRAIAATLPPLFDDVTSAQMADELCARSVQLAADLSAGSPAPNSSRRLPW